MKTIFDSAKGETTATGAATGVLRDSDASKHPPRHSFPTQLVFDKEKTPETPIEQFSASMIHRYSAPLNTKLLHFQKRSNLSASQLALKAHKRKLRLKLQGNIYKKSRYAEAD